MTKVEIEDAREMLKSVLHSCANMGAQQGESMRMVSMVRDSIAPCVDGLCDLALKGLLTEVVAPDPVKALAAKLNELDAARYRFLQKRSCGNATGGKGSDEECYLSLNPRDMDAAIDSHLKDEARRSPPRRVEDAG